MYLASEGKPIHKYSLIIIFNKEDQFESWMSKPPTKFNHYNLNCAGSFQMHDLIGKKLHKVLTYESYLKLL